MQFFVYGMLKSDQPKAWMIPFSRSEPLRLYDFKMYLRPDGKAAMKRGSNKDYVDGEVRDVLWCEGRYTGWFMRRLLLWFLDLNEGVSKGIYERVNLKSFDTYIYKKDTKGFKTIHHWEVNRG